MIFHDWIATLHQLRQQRTPCVLITVLSERGSVPRDSGSKMIVTASDCFQTIGGGHLEYECIAMARRMLTAKQTAVHSEAFSLGARLGQCCGGMTTILFEPLLQPQPQILLFGAGHVGQALVRVLATLPCHIRWIDERDNLFGAAPEGVSCCQLEDPLDAVLEAAPDSYFIIMTHDHQRDLALCEAILRRGDFRWFGVIGSQTKRDRFVYRLQGKGFSEQQLATMRCPIGLPAVTGKLPAEIAVAVAAEIISHYQAVASSEQSA